MSVPSGVTPMIVLATRDPEVQASLPVRLRSAGFLTSVVEDFPTAVPLEGQLGILDLDTGLVHLSAALTRLRRMDRWVPVIVLVRRERIRVALAAVTAGAADFLIKPVIASELLARMRLLGVDATPDSEDGQFTVGDLVLNYPRRRVFADSRWVHLTEREFMILELLMTNAGHIVPRAQLLHQVWGPAFPTNSNVVNVYIRALRNKIGRDRIITVRDVGYLISATSSEPIAP